MNQEEIKLGHSYIDKLRESIRRVEKISSSSPDSGAVVFYYNETKNIRDSVSLSLFAEYFAAREVRRVP